MRYLRIFVFPGGLVTDSQALEPTKPKKVRERPTYDPAMVERGLLALAECNGNGRKAARWLAKDENGPHIDQATLYEWKNHRHVEQYERVRSEVLPKVQLRAAERHMDLSDQLMDTEGLIVKRLNENVDNLDPRDLAGSLRNVSTSSAIHADKGQLLSDMPTEIRRLDTGEVLRKLGSRNMRLEATERTVVVESEPSAAS